MRVDSSAPEAVIRGVEAMSVSRVRTRDSGVAYSVRSRGGSNRSRSTVRLCGAAGMASATTVEVTVSSARTRASPSREPLPTPASLEVRSEDQRITVSWNIIKKADGYSVYRKSDNNTDDSLRQTEKAHI